MNSKFILFSVSLFINLINDFQVNATGFYYPLRYETLDLKDKHNFTEKDIFNLNQAFVPESKKWKNGIINFRIDKDLDSELIQIILKAMFEIEKKSCIRFVANNPCYGPNYVMITQNDKPSFNSSDIGCLDNGKQNLGLGINATDDFAGVLREFLHTIGFYDHSQRSDSSMFIKFDPRPTNLTKWEFAAVLAPLVEYDGSIMFLTPFDFDSVMLNNYDAFKINNMSVIVSKTEGQNVPSYEQRNRGLSDLDELLLDSFYNCKAVLKKKSRIFYEDATGFVEPMIVNYHEIERAKGYKHRN